MGTGRKELVTKSITILGIDPGYGRCGWGVIKLSGHHHQEMGHGVIETKADQIFSQRLLILHQELKKVIKHYQPDEIAVEELYFSKNVKTAIDVGQARGVILLTCAQTKVELQSYKPVQIKQAVTGFGRADKKQIQHMVGVILNLKQQHQLDDAADALAVALCHAQHRRQNKLIQDNR